MNIGTFVRYRLNDADIRNIKFRRARAVGWAGDHDIKAGDDFPAMVVKVVAVDIYDVRVFLNGTDDLWKANVFKQGAAAMQGEGGGTWAPIAAEATAPTEPPPTERVLKTTPGNAPTTVKVQKEAANG